MATKKRETVRDWIQRQVEADPEYQAQSKRRAEIGEKIEVWDATLQAREDAVEAAGNEDARVAALLAGRGPEDVAAWNKEVAALEGDIELLAQAAEACDNSIAEIWEAKRAAAVDHFGPGVRAGWEKILGHLVAAMEEHAVIQGVYEELEAAGVRWVDRLPVSVPQGVMSARLPDSDFNRMVAEIRKDWRLEAPQKGRTKRGGIRRVLEASGVGRA